MVDRAAAGRVDVVNANGAVGVNRKKKVDKTRRGRKAHTVEAPRDLLDQLGLVEPNGGVRVLHEHRVEATLGEVLIDDHNVDSTAAVRHRVQIIQPLQ